MWNQQNQLPKNNKLKLFYGGAGARKSRVSQKSVLKHKAEGKAKGEHLAQIHTVEKKESLLLVNQRRCNNQQGVKSNVLIQSILCCLRQKIIQWQAKA